MAVCGSRQIKNGEVVFVGTGLPMIASLLAKRTHAPRAKIVFESGFIDSNAKDLALSIADSRLGWRASGAIGLLETLGLMVQGGHVDVGFVGAAQIDGYGNINTTYIGSFEKPVVRLPGSGGGNDMVSSAKRIVVIMPHEKRKMVNKLDYLTSPGYLDGPGARERAGLLGGGPSLVVTTVHPGVTSGQVLENSGFDLKGPKNVPTTEFPTCEELDLLRAIDPTGIYIPRTK
jgi:glutaconate CoA-transferase subunit B